MEENLKSFFKRFKKVMEIEGRYLFMVNVVETLVKMRMKSFYYF